MKLLDAHAHIQQHDPNELYGIMERAAEARVGAIIVSGVTVKDSERCVALAREHSMLLGATGVHPTDLTGPLTTDELRRLDKMAADPVVVAMSEVGIDHQEHVLGRDRTFKQEWAEVQEEAFGQQIEIARKRSLPIIFHVREHADSPEPVSAWPSALRVIESTGAGEIGGAAHYFQGNMETARSVLDAGFMISFGRPLLRIERLREIAAWLPADRIVIETDSYPQPFKKDRSKWTEPRHLVEVAECLAAVRGISVQEVANITTQNALSIIRDAEGTVRRRVSS